MIPDGSYSLETLLRFLRYASTEGLINPAAARSRKNATIHLSQEMAEEERRDLRQVDVDQLASRFHKLEESSIRSEALSVYCERLRMALTDFFAWMDHPETFKSVGGEGHRTIKRRAGAIDQNQQAAEQIALEATENPTSLVPIPLRDTRVVYVANLPLDLTRAEADRIARVARAYADEGSDIGPESSP